MIDLDQAFPHLSAGCMRATSITLSALAARAPTDEQFEMYDLERLLRDVQQWSDVPLDDALLQLTYGAHRDQRHSYVFAIDEMFRLGHFENPADFRRKFMVPRTPLYAPKNEPQFLDTIAESLFGVWFHRRQMTFRFEEPLPATAGNADFWFQDAEPRWVDCISVEPEQDVVDATVYLSEVVRKKWRKKFGRHTGARDLPCGIAVLLLKSQDKLMPDLVKCELSNTPIDASPDLWSDCPSLQRVWIAMPGWNKQGDLEMLAQWQRR